MRAAPGIGIVADENVARAELRHVVAGADLRDEIEEAAEMDGDVLGLAEGAALGVEQGGRAVAAFLDVGREAGTYEGLAHFLHD